MMQFFKNIFYCLIMCMSMATMSGMSHDDSKNPLISEKDLEEKLCIMHEHSSASCKNPQITASLHLFPSESSFTKITYFSPDSEEESNALIERVCSQYQKLWWFVTPNTKKFNLEQRLKEKGLSPFPLEAMFCSLPGKNFKVSEDASSTFTRMHTVETNQDWHNIHADAFNYPRKDLSKNPVAPKPEDPKMVHFGLLNNNKLASIGSLFIHEDWVGILNLATKKEEQNKKLGLLLINYLLKQAQERGAKYAIAAKNGELLSSEKERVRNTQEMLGFSKLFTLYIYYRQ